jgi:predicted GNAT family acetyltransferase
MASITWTIDLLCPHNGAKMSIAQSMLSVMEGSAHLPDSHVTLSVTPIANSQRNEVLSFLAERPVHTVIMAGMIRDNGFDTKLNRGTFYECRNSEGRLEGVGLIGHATLLETRTRAAAHEFALTAQIHSDLHMIMAEQEKVEDFWNHYADDGQTMRFACRELLFELTAAPEKSAEVPDLRLATIEDLEIVAPVHAAMAQAESGVNPLEADRDGFLRRCARRIKQNRVWVLVIGDQLVFKADVQAETPEVIYLEGIYQAAEFRGSGLARRCFTHLCRTLLARTRSLCVLANEENERAHAFYRLCGFRKTSNYDTIFLKCEVLNNLAS